MPSAWGHTRLLETDWRFITQESHCFSCGSVKAKIAYLDQVEGRYIYKVNEEFLKTAIEELKKDFLLK